MTYFHNAKPVSLACFFLLLAVCSYASVALSAEQLSMQSVADAVTKQALKNRFPNKLSFIDENGSRTSGVVEYTFNPAMHNDMADVYLRYQPDYACFVALDVETGAILNLTSFIKSDEQWDNLVMRSDYPAASVFKMVTAAAGLDMGKVLPSTVLPFNGKSTSLYKKHVLKHKANKWTRKPTLKQSFAKSINTVFARLGVYQVGADNLRKYASRFGFGQAMETDFNLPVSHLGLDLATDWEVAEAASGYTKEITLSPIHLKLNRVKSK